MSTVAHRQNVQRLYRASLRLALNWAISRELATKYAISIREEFEKGKKITNFKEAEKLVEMGWAKLDTQRHPDPYNFPYNEGGCTFQRNTPVPEQYLKNPYLDAH
mmetsp:Transcript_25883/g.51927  ORF Transcript_25883/g.51927 Transcript_25883/m.51927 type:complete len:105 (-) Transcript_25883:37-351(-)